MLVTGLLFLAGSSTPSSPSDQAPRRIALLIGIADYRHLAAADSTPDPAKLFDLRGPLNDVARVQEALGWYGFDSPENIKVLRDSEASLSGIASAFAWLKARATSRDDVVVVYFSGHGSTAPDRAPFDESALSPGDSTDEGLVPWDNVDPHDPQQLVLDDSLHAWLGKIATPNVTVIVDACFSGTITRGLRSLRKGAAPPTSAATVRTRDSLAATLGDLRYVVITAADAGETAQERAWDELGGRWSGVLTHFLLQALDPARGSTRTYAEVMRDVERGLQESLGSDATQHPQLEGAANARPLHVGHNVVPMASMKVRPTGRGIIVQAGAVHGLRRGAILDIVHGSQRRSVIARIRVESLGDTSAMATMLGGSTAIPAGARAVLSRAPAGAVDVEESIPVFLDTSAVDLAHELRRIPFVRLTSGFDAAVTLRRVGKAIDVVVNGEAIVPLPRAHVEAYPAELAWGDDPVPRPDTVTWPRDGFGATARALCNPLRRAWTIRALAGVRNPRPAAELLELETEVKVVDADEPRPVSEAPHLDVLRSGRRYHIYLRVAAHERIGGPLYASAVIAGYRWRPFVFFGEDPLGTATVPGRGEWTRLSRWPLTIEPPFGSELIRVYVGTSPFSFQRVIASAPVCPVAAAEATRSGNDAAELVWKTVDVPVRLRPARGG